MTIATDLQTAVGKKRRYFLKIDGVRELFWQRDDYLHTDGTHPGADPPGPVSIQDPSLIALWRLDEFAAGANAIDEGPYGLDATPGGGGPAPQPGVFYGKCRGNFNGKSLTVSDSTRLNVQRLTVSCWVQYNNTTQPSFHKIFHRDHPSRFGSYILGNNATASDPGLDLYFTDATSNHLVAGASLSAGAWHHVVGTWDGTWQRVYHDGVLMASSNANAGKTIDYGVKNCGIGVDLDASSQYCDGNLTDLAIFNEAKSAEWVRRMHSYGSTLNNSANYLRPGLNCLRIPGTEYHRGIDLGKMRAEPSQLTLAIDDIPDPASPSKSYFGKIFSPGRWLGSSAKKTVLAAQARTDQVVGATDDPIRVRKTTDYDSMDSSGVAYIGSEPFSYTGKGTQATNTASNYYSETLGTFTGITRGLWPAYWEPRGAGTNTMGRTSTFDVRTQVDRSYDVRKTGLTVSTIPASLIGRDVGLYVTTWDSANETWYSEDDAKLIWAGSLSDGITYSPSERSWSLSCESVIRRLEEKIAPPEGTARMVNAINLNGTSGRTFRVYFHSTDNTTSSAYRDITITSGYYTAPNSRSDSLLKQVIDGVNKMDGYIVVTGSQPSFLVWFEMEGDDGVISMRFSCESGTKGGTLTINPWEDGEDSQRHPCHALMALGFGSDQLIMTVSDNSTVSKHSFPTKPYSCYHPIDVRYNGSKLALARIRDHTLKSSQGDYGSNLAYVSVDDAIVGNAKDKGKYVAAYTSQSETTMGTWDITELTLASGDLQPYLPVNGSINREGFVGSTNENGSEASLVRNIYVPVYRDSSGNIRGPFEQLLYPMLSTGTTDYNHTTYDKLDKRTSLSIPSAIVDIDSFTDADASIMGSWPSLARRSRYLIEKPISWLKLLERESQLFGYVLTWDDEKLKLKNVFNQELSDSTITVDDSVRGTSDDYPRIEMSMDTVVNSWKYEVGHDYHTNKNFLDYVVNDRFSIDMLGITKQRVIKHPGVEADGNIQIVTDLLEQRVRQESSLLRVPFQRVSVTLSITMLTRIFPGDNVSVSINRMHPDPFGSGDYSVSGSAIVLDVGWDLSRAVGNATLLIYSSFSSDDVTPWAPSAYVDITQSNGGWTAGTKTLVTVNREFGKSTDSLDAAAFTAGDKVLIRERSPSDPTAHYGGGPWAATIDSVSSNSIVLTTDPFAASWDADKEHVIIFDDFATVVDGQKTLGIWSANSTTERIGSTSPKRWG